MTPSPTIGIRLTWTAYNAASAREMRENLADQMRGAMLQALQPACWIVNWTCWQGQNESKLNGSSTRYGVTLWLCPSP